MGSRRGPGARLRRGAVLAGAAAVLSAAAVVGPAPAQACGCGGYVAGDGYDVAVSREVAAIAWDGGVERIILRMDALSDAPDAGLLIPTPAPAEVALADAELFTELEDVIAPEVEVEYRWWPETAAGGGDAGAAPGAAPVDVLESVQLGPLEVNVLSASDADGLSDWLAANDYVMSDGLADALRPYVTEGWYYVAARLTTEGDTLSGGLQPIDLRFESDSLIYPMRLSAAAETDQFVRTYVFADQRVERTDPTASTTPTELRYAGELTPSDLRSPALAEIVETAPYLTVMDGWYHDPGTEIVSDFTFAGSGAAGDYREVVHEVRMRVILGMPAGPVLTLLGALALIAAAVGVRRVVGPWRRTRPAPPTDVFGLPPRLPESNRT